MAPTPKRGSKRPRRNTSDTSGRRAKGKSTSNPIDNPGAGRTAPKRPGSPKGMNEPPSGRGSSSGGSRY